MVLEGLTLEEAEEILEEQECKKCGRGFGSVKCFDVDCPNNTPKITMNQENKDLLLRDLCGRLPYGVKVQHQHQDYLNEVQTIEKISKKYGEIETESVLGFVDDFKPYLFPLSSMTDEQIMQSPISVHVCDLENLRYDSVWTELNSRFTDLIDLIDWLNKNHFDYRGLIEKGLAINATGLNIYN